MARKAHAWSKHDATLDDKIAAKVWKGEPGECWVWMAGSTGTGHAAIWWEGRSQKAYRIIYEHLVGPIPEGWDVDHECHNWLAEAGLCDGGKCAERLCVNPEHLVAKPHAANLLASPLTQASINKSKTECINGHEFTSENTRIKDDGTRQCRTCG